MEPLYGFRSLESFKQKFSPAPTRSTWSSGTSPSSPRIGLALTRAYLPDTPLRRLAVVGLKASRG